MDKLFDLLKEKCGLTSAEVKDYFTVEEDEKQWILRLSPKAWLEVSTYRALRQLCEELGGAYEKTPQPTFYIPKAEAEPKKVEAEIDFTKIAEGQVVLVPVDRLIAGKFNVRKWWNPESKAKLEESMKLHRRNLTPIAVRPWPQDSRFGEILGGHLRLDVAKRIGLEKVYVQVFHPKSEADAWSIAFAEEIKEPWTIMAKARAVKALKELGLETKEIAEIALETEENVKNLLRLTELPEEVQNLIDFGKLPHSFGLDLLQLKDKPDKLVELAKKASEGAWTQQKLRNEILNFQASLAKKSESVGVAPLPPKRPVSEKKPAETILDLASKGVHCENCNLLTLYPMDWHGHKLCPVCYEKAQLNPEAFLKKLKPTQPKPGKVEVKKFEKPKEKPEHRRALMQPPVSKVETEVIQELTKRGLKFETQKEFCVQSCTADIYFPKQRLAVFLDGPVHEGREERDEALREKLWSRHNVQPLTIEYEKPSKQQVQDIVQLILQALEERQ